MCCDENSIQGRLIHLRDKYGEEEFKKKLIGTNPGQVSRQSYEHWVKFGDRTPSAANIKSICEMFSVSSNWLLGMDPIGSYSPKIEDRAISEKTGLSSGSIEVLQYLHNAPKGSPVRHFGRNTVNFINRVLEDYLEEIGDDLLKEEYLRDNVPIVFSYLEEWITGCGFAETLEEIMAPSFTHRSLLKSMRRVDLMRIDDMFRSVTMSNIMKCLEDLAEKDGTFAETLKETRKSPGERYDCPEDEENPEEE